MSFSHPRRLPVDIDVNIVNIVNIDVNIVNIVNIDVNIVNIDEDLTRRLRFVIKKPLPYHTCHT